MTATQTLALTIGIGSATLGLIFVALWQDFRRPHIQTPEEVADTIAAILNDANMAFEPGPKGGVRVVRLPPNWDADNEAHGNVIHPSGRA